MSTTLYKQPSESRMFSMNFAANLQAGEKLLAVNDVSASPIGLTIGPASVSVDGRKALFRLSVGDAGESYRVTVKIITNQGNTLEGDGILVVSDNLN